MEHFAGIDVSLEQSSVCAVDGAGKIAYRRHQADNFLRIPCRFLLSH